ncbi:MAG: NAD(P)-dependent oxidoreductase [bacterium]|nr:NAD(P)-dependent oxidoreductase [bacterium]
MSSDSRNGAPRRDAARSLAGDSGPGRVLVTGAGGFLGRAVVARLLETGWSVEAVTSGGAPEPAPRHEALRWHECDLLDEASVERLIPSLGASHLVHLAWAPNRGIYTSPENFRWVPASARLLEAFFGSGGKRTVFTGSSAEYDWSSGICREGSTPLAGGGAYGAAKRALGELFRGLCELHAGGEAREVSGAWARLFFLFGPHEPEGRLVAAVARSLIEGGPVRCSEGTQIRDYMFVADAADALVELLRSDLTGPVNVASGEGVRVRDLVLDLAERVGGGGVERIEWGTAGRGANEAPLVVADAGRLRDELEWQPKIGRSEGLERTVAWWRQRLATKAEA